MKRLLPIAVLAAAILLGGREWLPDNQPTAAPAVPASNRSAPADATARQLQAAFENRQSDLQISGSAVVFKVLPDDTQGSRHQRFILRTETGQTILVAHNIDLADRLPNLKAGDHVAFNGEYEWNPQGGVIHWTHHDPAGRHEDGWLEHRGITYR